MARKLIAYFAVTVLGTNKARRCAGSSKCEPIWSFKAGSERSGNLPEGSNQLVNLQGGLLSH